MAFTLWSQDNFTKGELSPLMYSRSTVSGFYDGVRTAKNCIGLPQGGLDKRFGTEFIAQINTAVTDYKQVFFKSFQYSNECIYLIVIRPLAIDIYLEGFLQATVTTNVTMTASDIQTIDYTVLETNFVVCTETIRPKRLIRGADAAKAISGFTATTLTSSALTTNKVYPARFTTTTSFPASSPQIKGLKTYFIKTLTTTTFEVYSSATDAKAGINKFAFTSAGTGASLVKQNKWTFPTIGFNNRPFFDFDSNYNSITFTPGALSGTAVTLTASANIFAAKHVGGAFIGNGGISSITAVASATSATVATITKFENTDAIPGNLALLAEPVWSDLRGWPRKCSSFQNRAIFANTDLLNNGIWLSTINDYSDYNTLETDDDNAIAWFPTSDDVTYINYVVPFRSLTVHTNTGVYSTPLQSESAITPRNFSLLLQDSTSAKNLQPRGIDNQVIVVSGNDVYSMLWDGENSAYNSSIISIFSEHLIRDPIDEAAYFDLRKAGSKYIFIVNGDGSIAACQTLISQNIQGWVPIKTEQPIGNSYFRWVTGSTSGRFWFLTEREIMIGGSLATRFFIEELDFDLYVDCATKYTGAATDNLTGLSRFDGMAVQAQGNGYGFYNTVDTGVFNFTAHGQAVEVENAQVGFGIDVKIEPMPLSIITGQNAKTSSLTQPKHIRSITFMFNDVVGGTVNDTPISIGKFSEVGFGSPPKPMSGLFELSIMKGWDDFNNPSFTIEHNEPFNIRLLGLSYKVEV